MPPSDKQSSRASKQGGRGAGRGREEREEKKEEMSEIDQLRFFFFVFRLLFFCLYVFCSVHFGFFWGVVLLM